MSNKDELNNVFFKFLKKYLFPDFSNKMTRYVIGVGVAIIITPTPIKIVFYNWLINTFNLNNGDMLKLAEFQSSSVDYFWGAVLITIALIHNMLYRLIIFYSEKLNQADYQKKVNVDTKLFNDFITMLPSNSSAVELLKTHNFYNSFCILSVEEFEKVISTFDNIEHNFLNNELELVREKFISKLKEFNYNLSMQSHSINMSSNTFSCIPDLYRGQFEYPDELHIKIKKINEMSAECYKLYEDLICKARNILIC
ncbi:TPA: hypothetical protein ACKRTC_003544 [Proteus mirabilis]